MHRFYGHRDVVKRSRDPAPLLPPTKFFVTSRSYFVYWDRKLKSDDKASPVSDILPIVYVHGKTGIHGPGRCSSIAGWFASGDWILNASDNRKRDAIASSISGRYGKRRERRTASFDPRLRKYHVIRVLVNSSSMCLRIIVNPFLSSYWKTIFHSAWFVPKCSIMSLTKNDKQTKNFSVIFEEKKKKMILLNRNQWSWDSRTYIVY